MKAGDRIAANEDTLAYVCGDKFGRFERMDGTAYMMRMEPSGRLVPFREDQFRPARERADNP